MNKKIKILAILNVISYVVMGLLTYITITDLVSYLDNGFKFVLGNMPLVLIVCTSFILVTDTLKEFKIIKKEAIVDWGVRIAAFGITLMNTDKYYIKSLILVALIFNIVIEYKMNKKLMNTHQEFIKEELILSDEEKKNLRNFTLAINSGMFSIFVFVGGALSVPITKNMEGTTKLWFVPVIVSILVFRWFIKTAHKNYEAYFLDKEEGKRIFKRDIIFASIGYLICLIFSFVLMTQELYSLVTFIGILFMLPYIETMRRKSLRLRTIRGSLDREVFNSLLLGDEEN
ncbi:hypothetical protein [Clostridium intestinale]|uniref:Uncharacterized protein n=1 Tax=Clostridium intestinale TaxID=36845 RepID=A0A7D6VQP7_9CLOT|nr:hypothetical protein [Clostridium intestinale]QLY79669.1 hypothetical protein HZF06_22055 [Clostridium intestinale]